MSLDKDTVARIARLARLKVPEADLAPLAGELSGIFAWIEQLNEVDTRNVEPLSSVSDVTLPMRADKVTWNRKTGEVVAEGDVAIKNPEGDTAYGDRIVLTKSDPDAGGHHHSIPSRWIESVDDKVTIRKTADEAKAAWRDEDRSGAMFGERDRGDNRGSHYLNRGFSGTY